MNRILKAALGHFMAVQERRAHNYVNMTYAGRQKAESEKGR